MLVGFAKILYIFLLSLIVLGLAWMIISFFFAPYELEYAQDEDYIQNVRIAEVSDEEIVSSVEVSKQLLDDLEAADCSYNYPPESFYDGTYVMINYKDGGYELIGRGITVYHSSSGEIDKTNQSFDPEEFEVLIGKYLSR